MGKKAPAKAAEASEEQGMAPEGSGEAPKVAKKPSKAKNVKEVKVHDKNGAFVRSYNAEAHGDDFMAKAEGFAGKIGGKTEAIEGEESAE